MGVNEASGKIGVLGTQTYLTMAGISDVLAFYLGLVMVIRRTHHGARRLGVSFLSHGLAFHLNIYEFMREDKNAFGIPCLRGFAWIVLLAVSTVAIFSIGQIFSEPLDLRDQAPTRGEKWFIAGGIVTSFTTLYIVTVGFGLVDFSDPSF